MPGPNRKILQKKPIIEKPFLREKFHMRDKIREWFGSDETASKPSQLVEEFRRGLAEALNVEPGSILDGSIRKWLQDFIGSFTTKEERGRTAAPTVGKIRDLGRELGSIVEKAMSSGGIAPQQDVPLQEGPIQEPQEGKRQSRESKMSVTGTGEE